MDVSAGARRDGRRGAKGSAKASGSADGDRSRKAAMSAYNVGGLLADWPVSWL